MADNEQVGGGLGVDVYPDGDRFESRLRAIVLPAAQKVGRELATRITATMVRDISKTIGEGVRRGGLAALPDAEASGKAIGERLGKTARNAIEGELHGIDVNIGLDTLAARAEVAKLKADLAKIVSKSVRVNVNTTTGQAALTALEAQITRISGNVLANVTANVVGSAEVQQLADNIREVAALGTIDASVRASTSGEVQVQEMARDLRDVASLSPVHVSVTAAVTGAAKVKEMAKRLTELAPLSPLTVSVAANVVGEGEVTDLALKIGALAALSPIVLEIKAKVTGEAKVRNLMTAVTALSAAPNVNIDVDANVTGSVEVRRLARDVARMTDKTIRIKIEGGLAAALEMQILRVMAEALGTMRPVIHVGVDWTFAVIALSTILGLAGAVGAAQPNIRVEIDITGALAALGILNGALIQTQANAGRAAGGISLLAAVGITLLPALIPVLATAVVLMGALAVAALAAGAAIGVGLIAFTGVAGAVGAMGKAQDQAGKGAAQAAAKQAQMASAANAVRQAERGLTNALREEKAVQDDVVKARKEALEALQDLAFANADNSIQQREAELELEAAKKELDRIKRNRNAHADDLERAQIAVDKAELQSARLKTEGERLAVTQAEAVKKGIEGSDQVAAATERIRAAHERVIEATEGVQSAQQQMATAATSSMGEAGGAVDDLRKKMAALTPEGRSFARFLYSLKGELGGLRKAAERGLLPGAEAGLRSLVGVLPEITSFISIIATALGDLARKAGAALASPFWVQFFAWLAGIASRELADFGRIIGNVAEGIAALLMAFGPTSEGVVAGLADMTEGFADWAKGVGESEGFKAFIAYVQENGPQIMELFGNLVVVAVKLGIALAPLGALIITGLTLLLEWLAKQSPGTLIAIAAGIGAIAIALFFIVGGPVTLVVAGITAIVAALVYAYYHFETFRNVVDAVAKAIAIAAVWLWQNAIKPAFEGIVYAIGIAWIVIKAIADALVWAWTEMIAPAAIWLWQNVLKPAWEGISLAIDIAWALIQVVFGLINIFIREVLAPAFTWFYKNVIKPTWDLISTAITYVWETFLKPTFEALGGFIKKYVAPAFKSGVDAIANAWDGLKEASKIPVKFVVEKVLNEGIIDNYNKLARKFGVKEVERVSLPKGYATGGIIPGYTPGIDTTLIAVGGGEAVMRPEFTRAVGPSRVNAWNAAARTGGVGGVAQAMGLQAFAGGGIVEDIKNAFTDPIGWLRNAIAGPLNAAASFEKTDAGKIVVGMPRRVVEDAVTFVRSFVGLGGSPGGGPGGGPLGGSAGMMRILRAVFPGLPLISGFRPGSKTLSGSTSYHASDRAVDTPPLEATARWMFQNYGAGSREIITPWQQYNVHNGKPHQYTGAVWNQHNFAGGNAHNHWAYDTGGYLPRGISPYTGASLYNGLSAPEPVLTSGQWADQRSIARSAEEMVKDGRGDGPVMQIENYYARDSDAQATAAELDWRLRGRGH